MLNFRDVKMYRCCFFLFRDGRRNEGITAINPNLIPDPVSILILVDDLGGGCKRHPK